MAAEMNPKDLRDIWEHKLVGYDPALRRVWIGGQRLHHGATGAVVAAAGLAGLAARRLPLRDGLPVALIGTVLMAHDWKDRASWFRRGPQRD
jgi:hypothetical protein